MLKRKLSVRVREIPGKDKVQLSTNMFEGNPPKKLRRHLMCDATLQAPQQNHGETKASLLNQSLGDSKGPTVSSLLGFDDSFVQTPTHPQNTYRIELTHPHH